MTGPWEKYQRTDGTAFDVTDQPSAGLPSRVQAPAPNRPIGYPALPEQNLTVRALRMKGVADPDIAAAIGNPERMQQLINQNFRPGSVGTESAALGAAVAPIGEKRAWTIAALRGIPLAGAYVDKGAALLNAAAQPWLETGLSHAATFADREAENEQTIKAATDQFEKDHPIATGISKAAVGIAALAPFGATALSARAFGIAGEALLPSILKGATTFGLLNAGDTALRGGDAKDIAKSALFGAAGSVALPLAGKAVQSVAPFLAPILHDFRGKMGRPGEPEPTYRGSPDNFDGNADVPNMPHEAIPNSESEHLAGIEKTPQEVQDKYPLGVTPPERAAAEALPAELPKEADPTPAIAQATTGRTEMTPSGRQAPVFEGVMPELAERYPVTGPPVLKTDPKTGKRYLAKQLTSEEQELQAHLDAIQKELDAGNYEPWFDPAERFPANSANYPPMINTLNIRAVRPATQAKYEAMARDPEATKRILAAFHRGRAQEENARDYAAMGQLENAFIEEFGPVEGPRLFKEQFADAMGATTAGAKPRANLRMAHFASYLKQKGKPMPTNAYDVPYPAGGAYVIPNMKLFKKALMDGAGLTTPKGYDWSYEILGSDGLPIDRRISRLFHPDMDAPPPGTYGHFKQALIDLAKQQNVDPRYFRDMVWAGADPHAPMGQTLPPMRPGPPPMEPGPAAIGHNNPPAEFRLSPTEQNPPPTGHSVVKSLITEVNGIIERTHRITGMPRAEIVRRGELYKKIPFYGLGLVAGSKLLSDGGGADQNVSGRDRQDGEPQT
jgi:hypothetical protein